MKIGFVGLGRMGQPIATRLLQAGHALALYNRTPNKATELVNAGAARAWSVADACAGADAVLTMLADDDALRATALGAGGIVAHLAPGAVHVAMGTHGVDAIRELAAAHAERGQSLVAAPVLGRPEAAAAGQLGIVAAGPAEALERCRPLFAVIGRRTFDAGSDPAGASALKLANNFVLGCAIEAMAEAYALVRKNGVEPGVLHDVLTDGLFACPAYKTYARLIADEAWDQAGFTARLALKDVRLALAAGDAANVPLPGASLLRDRLLGALAHGDGERDWSVLALEQARASGLAR
jgi:3-hydroxyisobutyrate dehydrogenase-like beta-hydroxyacid dehydrogenase